MFNSDDPPSTNLTFELNFITSQLLAHENTLPYVRLTLGNEPNGFKTVGLCDTGCSRSICEYKTFIKIPNFKDFIIEEIKDKKINCANDTSLKIEYKAKIPIQFCDKDDIKYTFEKVFFGK